MGFFKPVPDRKRKDKRNAETDRRELERYSEIVDEIVGDESSDDTDHHDGGPVSQTGHTVFAETAGR
jgi:hypothetical protein